MKILVDETSKYEYDYLFYNSCTNFCELSWLIFYQGQHECLGVENCHYLMQIDKNK